MSAGYCLTSMALLTIILASLAPLAEAATVTTTITPNSVTMTASLSLIENLTIPLGNLAVTLEGSNATSAVNMVQDALARTSPGSSVASLELRAKIFNTSLTESIIEENYTMSLQGTSSNSGSHITTNVGFLFLNASDSLQVDPATPGNAFELNDIGRAYLLPALLQDTGTGFKYYLNGGQFLNTVIPGNATEKFSMLDFTFLPSLVLWNHQLDPLGSESFWTCSVESGCIVNQPYNLTVGIPSPEGGLVGVRTAIFDPSFQIVAPARAWLQGITINFDQPAVEENIAPLVMIVLLIVAMTTVVIDRRLSKASMIRTKKKR